MLFYGVIKRSLRQMQYQITSANKALRLAEHGLRCWEKSIFRHEVLELKVIANRICQEAEQIERMLSSCPQ